ncbi:MAG TPA: prephenate dehydrogenase/arogenate dehydrogenase family protein [Pyrinomonadaceae bacterium]|nr:prephenate dehydrogenase/arogenate dehydrogenase family protein [Pyrinomonadaceae bacterium]
MNKPQWKRVTVVGCGLIGASFAQALRKSGDCRQIAGWDSSSSVLNEALERGIVDEADQSSAIGTSSDLLYLSMPVGEIIKFLRERGGRIAPGALVTDTGSTKVKVCRAAQAYLSERVRFIGGHPIAGGQQSGLAHARGDLFENAPYVLTIGGRREPSKGSIALRKTLELLGARVIFMTAAEHDRTLALLSHLPQLMSSTLAAIVEGRCDAETLLGVAGTGYRDMTRLAGSSWSMWRDILATAPRPIAKALDEMIEKLTAVRDELHEQTNLGGVALPISRKLFDRSQQKRRE